MAQRTNRQLGRVSVWLAYDVEHEETGRYGQKRALVECSDAVGHACHGVFANAPVDVATGIVAVDGACRFKVRLRCQPGSMTLGETHMLEVDLVLPTHINRWRQICRADHQVSQILRERIAH